MVRQVRSDLLIQPPQTNGWNVNLVGCVGSKKSVDQHFSRRYESDLASVYDELRSAFARTVTPPLRDVED